MPRFSMHETFRKGPGSNWLSSQIVLANLGDDSI